MATWSFGWLVVTTILFASNQAMAQEKTGSDNSAAHPIIDEANPEAAEIPASEFSALSVEVRKWQSEEARPFLESYCADCHLEGADEGGVTLDELFNESPTKDSIKLWDRARSHNRLLKKEQRLRDRRPRRGMASKTAEAAGND